MQQKKGGEGVSVSKNTSRVMINIDNDLLAQIDRKCIELDYTRSSYICSILRSYELQVVRKSSDKRVNHRNIKRKYKKRRS